MRAIYTLTFCRRRRGRGRDDDALPFARVARVAGGAAQYVPGNAAYIAAHLTRCSIGTESFTVCATSSAAGPKPTQGMPNIPAIETPFVLNVQRLTTGGFPKS